MEQNENRKKQEMKQLIEEEVKRLFPIMYKQYADKYGVASVPLHRHNGADAPKIGGNSVENFNPLDASPGGVIRNAIAAQQPVNNEAFNSSGNLNQNPPTVYSMPVPVIYGHGVGVSSAFEAGNAPSGTIVMFDNGVTLGGLWVRTDNAWYRIALDGTTP